MITCQYQARRFLRDTIVFLCVNRACDKFHKVVNDEECKACLLRQSSAHRSEALLQRINLPDTLAKDASELETAVVEPKIPPSGRSQLCQIADIPSLNEKGFPFHFEPNGVLVFDRGEADWEPPPRTLNGFISNKENPWRFIPMWPSCTLRQQQASRTSCGFLNIEMVCKCPDASFDCPVNWTDCKACSFRKEEI